MVYGTTDDMSAVKKLSIRRGIKSPFGGKSNKKASKLGASGDNFVVGDECPVIASPPPVDGEPKKTTIEISPAGKASNEPGIDAKDQPILAAKTPSKKSYMKWRFRSRRSEDNGSVDFEPKTNSSDDDRGRAKEAAGDNNGSDGEPGSVCLENNGQLNGAGDAVVHDGSALCNACTCTLPTETGITHFFQKSGKCGYVVPMRRPHEQAVCTIDCKHHQDTVGGSSSTGESMGRVNGFLEAENTEERRDESDASGRDLNGNPPNSAACVFRREVGAAETAGTMQHAAGDRYHAPELPLPLKNRMPEPDLPPRPPKPASLRYRPPPEPCAMLNGVAVEGEDVPPRPPARPKNRTLGGGSLRPWNNLLCESRNNRATVYETIGLEPKEASLAEELAKLPRQPWYWGPLTQAQAEDKLAKLPDGSFLVRDSSDERYLLSLSFNSHGRTLHTRIEHRNGLFSLNDSDGHSSVVELIECAVKESRNGVYGYMRDALGVQSFPARLTNWVSRFTEMRSLQHLCRFLIREVYPRHHIQRLPLPKKIKEYILENQY